MKTVQRDLHYLKRLLPSDWLIHISKEHGITLYKPPHSSQTSIYSFFKRDDMRFHVLNQLFQGHIHTVMALADSLYMYIQKTSSVLDSVQDYLRSFHLELHKRPLRIVGKEAHIVYMFYELYFTTYGWEEWPFPEEENVFSYLAEMEQKLDIQFYPSYKRRIAFVLAILIRRKKQGHKMKISPVDEALIMETPFYHKINALPPVVCDVSLTKTDQIFITIAVNCCLFVHANQKQYKQEVLQCFFEGTFTVYRYAQILVERLEEVFHMPLHQDEEFLFCLLQCIRQVSYRSQFIPNFTAGSTAWHEQIKKKHTITFRKVRAVYTAWVQAHPALDGVNEEAILAITLQLEASFQFSQIYRKKVILYADDSIIWNRYLQSVLYHEFGNTLSIASEEVLDIETYNLQKLGIDGIISTLPLRDITVPVFQISVVPTRRELADIRAFLSKE